VVLHDSFFLYCTVTFVAYATGINGYTTADQLKTSSLAIGRAFFCDCVLVQLIMFRLALTLLYMLLGLGLYTNAESSWVLVCFLLAPRDLSILLFKQIEGRT